MFFVMIQHLTVAGWSVVVRRLGEFVLAGVPVLVLLSPLSLQARTLSTNGRMLDTTAVVMQRRDIQLHLKAKLTMQKRTSREKRQRHMGTKLT